MKLKVCGMRYEDNIKDIAMLCPDYLGFIFYEKSRRYMTGEIPMVTHKIKKVGVFVDAEIDDITAKIARYKLDVVQLHGSETVAFCEALKAVSPQIEIIKSFCVGKTFDFSSLGLYEKVVDFFLFDAKGDLPGGNGVAFDWKLLEDYPLKTPFFLSGGIAITDLPKIEVLQTKNPYLYAIDINSRFEIDYGLKDKEIVKKFSEKMKNSSKLIPIGGYPKNSPYQVSDTGYYGEYGGAFVPEMLYPNVEELREQYLEIMASASFQKQFYQLMKDYVGRPSPLYLAERLSKQFGAKIYLKREDLNHTGAHKINNTIGQVLIAKHLNKTRIIAETGAGQHGVATATVCALMGLKCVVYMGEIDIKRQAPNVARMKMLGAEVRPALSGSRTLKDATNEAIRDWINNPTDTHYIIGSVVGPHPYPDMVARFQGIISEEIRKQLQEKEGSENPNYLIACVGGGSNAAGTFFHYLDEEKVKLVAVEAAGKGIDSGASAATSVLGKDGIIHGSHTLLMQTEDGQITEPYSISAGLDYPGVGPLHSHLLKSKRADFISATDEEAMNAGLNLCKQEGIIPAIESAHALVALGKIKLKKDDIVVVCLSGRGDKDLETYIDYFNL